MIEIAGGLLDILQIAHETPTPHQEPAKGNGGGASTVLIVAGVVLSLALVGALVWVKNRTGQSTGEGS